MASIISLILSMLRNLFWFLNNVAEEKKQIRRNSLRHEKVLFTGIQPDLLRGSSYDEP